MVTLKTPVPVRGGPTSVREAQTPPVLEALEVDGRIVVVFSPYDISCAMENSVSAECKGYIREDAAKLGVNIVLFALFVLGGELIHNFSVALIIGVLVGTYSSIYVASATTLRLGVSKADLMPVQKEGAEEADARP